MKVVRLAMVSTLMVCLATGVFGQTSGINNNVEAVNQELSCNPGTNSGWFSRPYSRHYIVDYSDQGQQTYPAQYPPSSPVPAAGCDAPMTGSAVPMTNYYTPAENGGGYGAVYHTHGFGGPFNGTASHHCPAAHCPATHYARPMDMVAPAKSEPCAMLTYKCSKDCCSGTDGGCGDCCNTPKCCETKDCPCCHPTCPKHGMDCKDGCDRICTLHGKSCTRSCLGGHFGYGANCACPPPGKGPCAIHGNGPCPLSGNGPVGQCLRGFFSPCNQPYFGMNPLPMGCGYGPADRCYPGYYGQSGNGGPGCFASRHPKLHAIFSGQPAYNSTKAPEQMNTYTTRGPRDFLNPNPPSIGY